MSRRFRHRSIGELPGQPTLPWAVLSLEGSWNDQGFGSSEKLTNSFMRRGGVAARRIMGGANEVTRGSRSIRTSWQEDCAAITFFILPILQTATYLASLFGKFQSHKNSIFKN